MGSRHATLKAEIATGVGDAVRLADDVAPPAGEAALHAASITKITSAVVRLT